MKLGLKFGFKMLLRNPVRVAASLLAAIAAFGISLRCVIIPSLGRERRILAVTINM